MPLTATVAVVLAAGLDRLFAEPPASIHPVALLGGLIAPLDRSWSAPRAVGVVIAVVLPLLVAGVAGGLVYGVGSSRIVGTHAEPWFGAPGVWLGALLTALVLFSTTSLRLLLSTARDVVSATERNLDTARHELRALAGRDASDLSAAEIRSAAVESTAENLADGLVAPLGAFAVGVALASVFGSGVPTALALGAAGAAWVKAVNTLDSMLGYRSKPVGWAPARLDDLVMWVPARASALLIALAAGDPGALKRARSDARVPSSPNSGWPMATVAAVLDVRLEKPGHYVLGDESGAPSDTAPSLPNAAVAERAIRIVSRAGWLAVALAGVIAWV